MLAAAQQGDPQAADNFLPLVYDELRCMAAIKTARQPGETLQATALVHEAWLRLAAQSRSEWKNREQFYSWQVAFLRRAGECRNGHVARRVGEKRAAALVVRQSVAGPSDPGTAGATIDGVRFCPLFSRS